MFHEVFFQSLCLGPGVICILQGCAMQYALSERVFKLQCPSNDIMQCAALAGIAHAMFS